MQIRIPEQPVMLEVERSAWAPWLAPGVRRFELCDDYVVWVDGVEYVVPAGYITDKASIPKWLHWLFPPSYGPSLCAAIWHDRAYSHWYKTMPKRYADEVFRQIMINQGARACIADLFHWCASTFGKGGWK